MSHPPPSQPLISRPSTPPPLSPAPLVSSSRATTAPVKAKHHIPHHPHRLHHRVPPSATQTSSSSNLGDGLNPVSRVGTRNEGSAETQEKAKEKEKVREDAEREARKWKAVEEKREGRRKADETLRQTLHTLTQLSTTTTRRLDYTYYSLLEHSSTLSTLTTTLSSLGATTAAHLSQFRASTAGVASTFRAQTAAFEGTFAAQARRIGALEDRLARGRARVGALGRRLEGVRAGVEGCQRGEREWAGRVRTRVRMLWAAVGVVVALFLVLLVVRRAGSGGRGGELEGAFSRPVGNGSGAEGSAAGGGARTVSGVGGGGNTVSEAGSSEAVWKTSRATTARSTSTSTSKSTLAIDEDPRLKVFDEL